MTNIALISWDSVRADHLPIYGYKRNTTPFLSSIADDATIFDDAFVSGVGTPTSFTGVFTGNHAHAVQTNISPKHWRESNKQKTFLQEILQAEGYYTGAIHSNALMSRHYGWNRGWDKFKDNRWTEAGDGHTARRWNRLKKTTVLPRLRRLGLAAPTIHAKNILFKQRAYATWESMWEHIISFIDNAPEPWFLWVLLVDTHHPWYPPKSYQEWEQPGMRGTYFWNYIMKRRPKFVGSRKPAIVNAYDNSLRYADDFMSEFMNLIDDTVVMFHSDHGDELGEHGTYGHRPAMWDTVTRVPLMIWNGTGPQRVTGPHTLLDTGSTILEIADIDMQLGGRPSLVTADHDYVYVENREQDGGKQAAVVDSEWKVIYNGDWLTAYNRDRDPLEQKNRLQDVPLSLIKKLQYELDRRDFTTNADTGELEPETIEQLTELGYIE